MQSGWACPLHLPTLPVAQTPADPDADMRAWLRAYATKHPCHGFRRAWAALRYDERREVNKKKVHRLWREEGPAGQGRTRRASGPGCPRSRRSTADAPNVVWAVDFPVRLHHRRQGDQDRVDDRRAHPRIAAEHRGTLDHRRAARRRARGRCSPRPAGHRRCCGWTTVRSWFLKRCNGSARTRSVCSTSRRVHLS